MFQHILSNFFFLTPPQPEKNLVGFQKFQNESMFQQILSNFFFFPGTPPYLATHLKLPIYRILWSICQLNLKVIDAFSREFCLILNINFQYISIYFENFKKAITSKIS